MKRLVKDAVGALSQGNVRIVHKARKLREVHMLKPDLLPRATPVILETNRGKRPCIPIIFHAKSRKNLKFATPRFSFSERQLSCLSDEKRTALATVLRYLKISYFVISRNHEYFSAVASSTKSKKTKSRRDLPGSCFVCDSTTCLTNHHTVPLSRGGKNGPNVSHNLTVLCEDCHTDLNRQIERMEKDTTKPLCYLDYVGILVQAALQKAGLIN